MVPHVRSPQPGIVARSEQADRAEQPVPACRPRLLLFDELAAGLSPVNVDNLLRIILGLKDRYGLTVVIVEHILRVVMDTCGIVTVLDHGQKIAEGTPDEVKNDHAVIKAYLGREMGDEEVRAALEA